MGCKHVLFFVGLSLGGIFLSCSRTKDVKIDFDYKYRTEISIPKNWDSTFTLSGTIPFNPVPEFVASPHQVIGIHVSAIQYGYYFIECLDNGEKATFSAEVNYFSHDGFARKLDINANLGGDLSAMVAQSAFPLRGSQLAEMSIYAEKLMLEKGLLPYSMVCNASNLSEGECSFFIELSFIGNAVAEVKNN